MDLKEIKALLEKYYNGESNLQEEKILREYFGSKTIDPELIADKDIFLYQIQENDNNNIVPDITDEIWSSLNKNKEFKLKKKSNLIYIYLRIAASIIILAGSYFLLKNQVFDNSQKIHFTDTYETPEIAYEQAKETLLHVSALLNNGASHLEPIQKINEGTQKLNKLSSFNEGLEELKPIEKYNKADKYFK